MRGEVSASHINATPYAAPILTPIVNNSNEDR